MRFLKTTLAICGLLLLLPLFASGQTVYSLQQGITEPLFSADYASFRTGDVSMNRLEIYYLIFNSDLAFVKRESVFYADYEIIVAVYDKKNRPIASKTFTRSISTDEYSRTLSTSDYRIGQVTFEVAPEQYKITCDLNDKNAGNSVRRELKAELTKYDNRNPQISDIQFVHAVEPSGEDTTFTKGNMDYVPVVRRIYGGDTTATVRAYFEIYRGSGEETDVTLLVDLVDFNENSVYHDEERISFDNGTAVTQYYEIPLKGIKGGEYDFVTVLRGKRGRDVDKVEEPITIHWTPGTMILNDPEKGVEILKYIASKKDLDAMSKAETAAERLRLWNEFWLGLDPTPGTPENEVKDDYFERIEFANQNFSIMQREGWRTDRGMVFIQYGPPDQIEDHPFELDSKAYQIWYYYRSGNQVREFLFVDEFGNNDYVLQFPYDGIRY